MKPRTKKVLGWVGAILVLLVGGPLVWDFYSYEKQIDLGGYRLAGIQPVPGATVASMQHINETMFGGTTIWVYKLPAGYAEAFYKNCSRIGYQQGTYLSAGGSYPTIDHLIKANEPGCYLTKFTKDGDIIAQFVGDELIVQDMY